MQTPRQFNFPAFFLLLLSSSVMGWLLLSQTDMLPGVSRELRCAVAYAQKPAMPYKQFLVLLESGKVPSMLYNAEQSMGYFQQAGVEQRVKLPELDATWQDLIGAKQVSITELAEGGC
ncbi:MAG: hypothetical protein WCA07_00445 [Gloeobacterales cyanobacterium]